MSSGEREKPRDEAQPMPSPVQAHAMQGDTELQYRYLTFATDLAILPPTDGLHPARPAYYASPLNWSRTRKGLISVLACIATLVTSYTPGAYAAGLEAYEAAFHVEPLAATAGITIFNLCFAISPMILAPLSELQGRRPVFVTAGIIFVIAQIGSAVTRTFAGLLITRALAGASSAVFSTMVGGVVSELYVAAERNGPMVLFSGASLCGAGIGPMVSSILVQHVSWRWIYYVQALSCGVVVVALIVFFDETRGSVILSKKASAWNEYYDAREKVGLQGQVETLQSGSDQSTERIVRIRWKVKDDEERATVGVLIKTSLLRPIRLLFTESVVFWISLWMAFAWSTLYMAFEAIPLAFRDRYQFNTEQTGLVFIAMSVGAILAAIIAISIPHMHRNTTGSPEYQLYPACFQSMLLPVGLFWLGWTVSPTIHWIVPVLSVASVTMGIFSVQLAVFNYLADTYGAYASSTLAAQSFCRNVIASLLPLAVDRMFGQMTIQGAFSLLGGVGIGLSVVPWVLVLYGPRIRGRSKFMSSMDGR